MLFGYNCNIVVQSYISIPIWYRREYIRRELYAIRIRMIVGIMPEFAFGVLT